jgi:hypothetical protein
MQARSPLPVMSADEIRHWIKELRGTYGWGRKCLVRTLGAYDDRTLYGKLKGKWFYRGERKRFSRQIDRILSGELICMKRGQRYDAVLADHPVPLRVPARMKFDFATGRVGWVRPRAGSELTLRGFGNKLYERPG